MAGPFVTRLWVNFWERVPRLIPVPLAEGFPYREGVPRTGSNVVGPLFRAGVIV